MSNHFMLKIENPTAPEEFIAICMEGIPIRFNMKENECILSKNFGAVKSLKKLAMMSLTEQAMKNKGKKEKLEKLLNSTEISCFNRLIFGDCPPFVHFIMSRIGPLRTSSIIRMNIKNSQLQHLNLNELGIVKYTFEDGDQPIEKIGELLPYIYGRETQSALILLDDFVPAGLELCRKFREICDRCLPHLQLTIGGELSDPILVYRKERRVV